MVTAWIKKNGIEFWVCLWSLPSFDSMWSLSNLYNVNCFITAVILDKLKHSELILDDFCNYNYNFIIQININILVLKILKLLHYVQTLLCKLIFFFMFRYEVTLITKYFLFEWTYSSFEKNNFYFSYLSQTILFKYVLAYGHVTLYFKLKRYFY